MCHENDEQKLFRRPSIPRTAHSPQKRKSNRVNNDNDAEVSSLRGQAPKRSTRGPTLDFEADSENSFAMEPEK